MKPNETPQGTPGYQFLYLRGPENGHVKTSDIVDPVTNSIGITKVKFDWEVKPSKFLKFTGFISGRNTGKIVSGSLENGPEAVVRFVDIITGSGKYKDFRNDPVFADEERLTQDELSGILKPILLKNSPESNLPELDLLKGKMAPEDIDFVVAAYLSQGRVDMALKMIQNCPPYLREKYRHRDVGTNTNPQSGLVQRESIPNEELIGGTLNRLFDPNRNQKGNDLFPTASMVLRRDPNNNDLYKEMLDELVKWPSKLQDQVPVQLSHLVTRLGLPKDYVEKNKPKAS